MATTTGATLDLNPNVTKRVSLTGYSNVDNSVQSLTGFYVAGQSNCSVALVPGQAKADITMTVVGSGTAVIAAYNSLGAIISIQIPLSSTLPLTADRIEYTVVAS